MLSIFHLLCLKREKKKDSIPAMRGSLAMPHPARDGMSCWVHCSILISLPVARKIKHAHVEQLLMLSIKVQDL
jgi:hypothetical protein